MKKTVFLKRFKQLFNKTTKILTLAQMEDNVKNNMIFLRDDEINIFPISIGNHLTALIVKSDCGYFFNSNYTSLEIQKKIIDIVYTTGKFINLEFVNLNKFDNNCCEHVLNFCLTLR